MHIATKLYAALKIETLKNADAVGRQRLRRQQPIDVVAFYALLRPLPHNLTEFESEPGKHKSARRSALRHIASEWKIP